MERNFIIIFTGKCTVLSMFTPAGKCLAGPDGPPLVFTQVRSLTPAPPPEPGFKVDAKLYNGARFLDGIAQFILRSPPPALINVNED